MNRLPGVYSISSPSDKTFKGRNNIFHLLNYELSKNYDHGQAFLLFGIKRSGKTSILRQLSKSVSPEIISIYSDLMIGSLDVSELLLRWIKQIQSSLASININPPKIEEQSLILSSDPYSFFDNWFKQIEPFLGKHKVLLAVDEYPYLEQMLLNGKIDDRMFSMFQRLTKNQPKFIVLFCGVQLFEDLSSVWSYHFPDITTIWVGPLEEFDARRLIEEPLSEFNLQFEPRAIDRILQFSGCHPYLIQSICICLVENLNELKRTDATFDDIELIIAKMTKSPSYETIFLAFKQLNKHQESILHAINLSQAITYTQLQSITKLSDETLEKNLFFLENTGYIKSTNNNYLFTGDFIKKVLKLT